MQHEDSAVPLKGAQALDMLRPKGAWLPDVLRSALRLLHLEANGQIAGQQRISFPAGNSFLRVLRVLFFRATKGDERGCKFHLRIVAA